MKNVPLLIGTIVGTLLLVVAIGWFFSMSAPGGPGADQATVDRALVEQDSRHKKGQLENPAVVVVEFSDFQCPACRSAAPLVEQLSAEFGTQVQFVFKHYPLETIHPNAFSAALAAESAALQGKFWEMHNILFEKQDEWATIKDANELTTVFVGYAKELGLNEEDFKNNLDSETVKTLVQNDINTGNSINVNSTPSFVVNGKLVSAAALAETIETELAAATTPDSSASGSAQPATNSAATPAL